MMFNYIIFLHLSLNRINWVKTYEQSIANAVFLKNETYILKQGIYIF